jgi:hypothetical protein
MGDGYYYPRGAESPPDYERTVRALPTSELEEEISLGRGGEDYQAALRAELDARRRPLP